MEGENKREKSIKRVIAKGDHINIIDDGNYIVVDEEPSRKKHMPNYYWGKSIIVLRPKTMLYQMKTHIEKEENQKKYKRD